MKDCKLGIPTNAPGGLDSTVSSHFGHCDGFTVVTVKNGEAIEATLVELPDHGHGGCMLPVRALVDAGVDAVVVGGIGQRPLHGFVQFEIPVFHAGSNSGVCDVVSAFAKDELSSLDIDQACGGGHAH